MSEDLKVMGGVEFLKDSLQELELLFDRLEEQEGWPVTDQKTGLVWQQVTTSSGMTWEAALTYCEDLTLANQSDWRLPNIKELGSIVDRSQSNPAIDTTAFPGTQPCYCWSSTTYVGLASGVWGVYPDSGYVTNPGKSGSYSVRCVRGR